MEICPTRSNHHKSVGWSFIDLVLCLRFSGGFESLPLRHTVSPGRESLRQCCRNWRKTPNFRDNCSLNRTGESGLPTSVGATLGQFLRMALGQSGFNDSIMRMQNEHKPIVRRKRNRCRSLVRGMPTSYAWPQAERDGWSATRKSSRKGPRKSRIFPLGSPPRILVYGASANH